MATKTESEDGFDKAIYQNHYMKGRTQKIKDIIADYEKIKPLLRGIYLIFDSRAQTIISAAKKSGNPLSDPELATLDELMEYCDSGMLDVVLNTSQKKDQTKKRESS